jgi:hypothetical protein
MVKGNDAAAAAGDIETPKFRREPTDNTFSDTDTDTDAH